MKHDSVLAIEWFESNYMKLNDLCKYWAEHDLGKWKEKLLGVIIDKHLKFEEHIGKQCRKPGQKPSALARACNILNQERQRIR